MNTESKSQILKKHSQGTTASTRVSPAELKKKKEKKVSLRSHHYRLIKPACASLEAATSLFTIRSFLRKNKQGKENGRLQKTTNTFCNLLFTWDN